MPELPEVETVRNTLKNQILNKRIIKIDVFYSGIIENVSVLEFKTLIKNQVIIDILRKGKYLIFILNQGCIITHLRMEGKFFLKNEKEIRNVHEHIIFHFDDNTTMRYHDTRKFGKMAYLSTNKIKEIIEYPSLKKLGPDGNIEGIKKEYLYEHLQKRNQAIKTALLDQEIIAGLGNIYVDEVCYRVKINPLLKTKKVTLDICEQIIKYSKIVLDEAINQGGTTIRSYTSSLGVTGRFQQSLMVHNREGENCYECNSIIKKIVVGGRGTYYCPKCQKVPYKVIGITGSISSGKSVVTDYLRSKKYKVIDSDEISKELFNNPRVIKMIVNAFGIEVLENNMINRKLLGQIIFNDREKRIKLNNIVHPLVKKEILRQIDEYANNDLIFVDIPLLFEAKFEDLVDYIIVVNVEKEIQIERLMARDNIDREYAEKKINSQMSLEEKCQMANFIIDNSFDICYTYKQIDEIINKVKKG